MSDPQPRRVLSLADVILFNIVVIFSVRGITTAARIGPAAIVLWLVAVAAFFIPLGLAVSEMASRDPGQGGFYRWIRDAFGDAAGFLSGWLYWVSNIAYLPSLLIFLASAVAYATGRPELAERGSFVITFALAILWLVTWLNVRGLQLGRMVTGAGAAASWTAAFLLIVAGAVVLSRVGSATEWSLGAVMGLSGNYQTMAYFGTLSLALVGLELAPVIGGEIRDARRTIPRALVISGAGIAILYVLGTVAILVALRPEEVSPLSGMFGALSSMGTRLGWPFLAPLIASLVSFAVIGGVAAWLGAVARLPYAVGLDRFLPRALSELHPAHGTPHRAIVLQAAVVSLFIVTSQAGSTVRDAYLVLLDMTIILNFIPLIFLFLALPRLRPARDEDGVIRIPGGAAGLWLVALLGLAATLLTLASAVVPPPDLASGAWKFSLKLWGGLLLFTVLGYLTYQRYHRAA